MALIPSLPRLPRLADFKMEFSSNNLCNTVAILCSVNIWSESFSCLLPLGGIIGKLVRQHAVEGGLKPFSIRDGLCNCCMPTLMGKMQVLATLMISPCPCSHLERG